MGSVILKRLEDAQADNDPIFGIIAGAYTNHCGQTDSITRPHEGDQVSVFKRILRHANVNPLHVSYIEMHGTGTQAGDATEMNSVLSVFVPGFERMPHYPLYLGSVKANIGHAESASGVSSLIKVLMMMKHNEIPPHCGIKTKINHNYPLNLKERGVNIAFNVANWTRSSVNGGKRTVFLNNFSAAGGNTAVLLEDAPFQNEMEGDDPRSIHIITISAKTKNSLVGNVQSLLRFLRQNLDISLPALSYTTTARRMHYNYRMVYTSHEVNSLIETIERQEKSVDVNPIPTGTKVPKIVFVFTGQGSLYSGLGKQLFRCISQFRDDITRFDNMAKGQGFPSFLPLVDGSLVTVDDVPPVVAQLALVCVQMALCRLWISWGIRPSSSIGHSLGEYAALYAAGILTANDAIYVVGKRAELLSEVCTEGTHTMLAIKASLEEIKPRLVGSRCDVSCINQPANNVISGPSEDINSLMVEYRSRGHECVLLNIPFAFHSSQVDPVLKSFHAAVTNVRFRKPLIPFMSPLLGKVLNSGSLDSSYVVQACRGPVNFQGALEAAKSSSVIDENTIWLEIGAHPLCSNMIKGTLGSNTVTIASMRKDKDTWHTITAGLKLLYSKGIDVQWNEYHRDFNNSHQILQLPMYSWDLKNYWIPYRNNFCLTKGDVPIIEQPEFPLVPQNSTLVYISPSVQRVLEETNGNDVSTLLIESDIHDRRLSPIIVGHRVNGTPLCPSVSQLVSNLVFIFAKY